MIIKTTRDNIMEVLEYLEKEDYKWAYNNCFPTNFNPYEGYPSVQNPKLRLVLILDEKHLTMTSDYEYEVIRTLEDIKVVGLEHFRYLIED